MLIKVEIRSINKTGRRMIRRESKEIRLKEKIKIPTIKEIKEKGGLTWEEAAKRGIFICGTIHMENNIDCSRKLHGHSICEGCPKYYLKTIAEKTKYFEFF
jgi:hypothetical protein